MTSAPIIVSALFGPEDFAWLNGLRQEHFPPMRNQVDAHLTLFHHLPPSAASELKDRLVELTKRQPPGASADGFVNLGRGVAIRIRSPDLEAMREELAEAFASVLTPQDAAGWRPHVTIQNKVDPAAARSLHASLSSDFQARRIRITGLATWWYRAGPWELLSRHPFR